MLSKSHLHLLEAGISDPAGKPDDGASRNAAGSCNRLQRPERNDLGSAEKQPHRLFQKDWKVDAALGNPLLELPYAWRRPQPARLESETGAPFLSDNVAASAIASAATPSSSVTDTDFPLSTDSTNAAHSAA